MADQVAHGRHGAQLVRIDSAEEQYAYLLTHFGEPDRWSVVDQRLGKSSDGRDTESVSVRDATGAVRQATFVAPDDDVLGDVADSDSDETTGFVPGLMEAATRFSADNPPHHPGTIARFPVPSAQYRQAVAIPMPVLAIDGGRRGLYAPPRVVVIDIASRQPVGVGEFPGFDPERWPPPRLGDWPPPSTRGIGERQLEGMVARLSACWKRILDAWFAAAGVPDSDLAGDIEDALAIRARLDLPAMLSYYDRLNREFATWLVDRAG